MILDISLQAYACALVSMQMQAETATPATKARIQAAIAELQLAEAAYVRRTFTAPAEANLAAIGGGK